MDLHDLWQENKRFVIQVALGALVFLIGLYSIQTVYGDELDLERANRVRLERQLAEPRFEAADRDEARGENEALREVLARLAGAVAFEPRTEFTVLESTSAVNQYHRAVAAVRDRLLLVAGRSNLFVDRDLGLPKLSPSNEEEIARYLAGLDAVERAVGIALATGVERVDEIRIRLDPALASRDGPKDVERTRVELELAGSGLALTSFLARTQRSGERPLSVESVELRPAPKRRGEARLALVLALVRLHGAEPTANGGTE